MLGKRKREVRVVRRVVESPVRESTATQAATSQDIFRQYFEAKFNPLPTDHSSSDREDSQNGEEDGSEDADEFAGFSDEEHDAMPVVEVVDTTAGLPDEGNSIDKIFKKSFMSSKPPREIDSSTTRSDHQGPKSKGADDEEDATNLKNDLDLQRLLRESHLLSQNAAGSDLEHRSVMNRTTLHGKQRHEATDLRLMELGSKDSLYKQDRMPMSHRKGIKSKNVATEERRRRDAKENGVILERAKSKKDARGSTRRERGVDVPVLGKFRGGTLSLSKRDVANIQGPSARSGKKRSKR